MENAIKISCHKESLFRKIWRNIPHRMIYLILAFTAIALSACAPPQPLPSGPTAIPTLIPATLPARINVPTEAAIQVIESYPVGLPSAMNGQGLYETHCASCHGSDGKGVVPNARNFGDLDYMRGETPAEFYLIITEGRGGDMPAFGTELNSDERWAIVYYVWRLSTDESTLLKGLEIYRANCAACHGNDGNSMILGAANFPDQRFMTNMSPSNLYISVTQGVGSMPAWQARLSQDDRWAVIDYVRTFTYAPQIATSSDSGTPEATLGNERPECAPYVEETYTINWEDSGALSSGQGLYDDYCAGCHNNDGTGKLPGIINFTSKEFHLDLNANPGKYICSIAEGYQNMPAFKSQLSNDDVLNLAIWIASFK